MAPEIGWVIFLAPLAAAVIILLFTRSQAKLSGYLSIAAIAVSWVCALAVFTSQLLLQSDAQPLTRAFDWLAVGELHLRVGVYIDGLAAVMLVVVTTVSLLVQIYSQGYMAGDSGYSRFFIYLSMFTASMLGLVLADDLIIVFVFWELVGLCSFLLIGFWFAKPEAAAAAKKAFITTRVGDVGFMIGIMILFALTPEHTTNIRALEELVTTGALTGGILTWAALGVFSGAAGKSAQFPLHVWLPDAMEGPTPVSALIHAATMVAAGVYLVARMFFLYDTAHGGSLDAANVVLWIGVFTAVFTATMGFVMFDIKRVLAYSTLSQLGYMMAALGLAGVAGKGFIVASIFHLFTHAFFKALLFLGSGSVIHGTGTQDMREMGGLRRYMPRTYWTFLIGTLALAGIFPFAGFWSKDEILLLGYEHNQVVFWLLSLGALMTAFYMGRLVIMTFFGKYRGPQPALRAALAGAAGHPPADEERQGHGAAVGHGAGGHGGGHGGHGTPHESPYVMTAPLIALAGLSIVAGWLAFGGTFAKWLEPGVEHGFEFDSVVAVVGTVAALLGFGIAYAIYQARWVSAAALTFKPLWNLVANRYYLDDLYEQVLVGGLVLGLFGVLALFDKFVIDGIVNGLGRLASGLGTVGRLAESGKAQVYALALFTGVVLLTAGFFSIIALIVAVVWLVIGLIAFVLWTLWKSRTFVTRR